MNKQKKIGIFLLLILAALYLLTRKKAEAPAEPEKSKGLFPDIFDVIDGAIGQGESSTPKGGASFVSSLLPGQGSGLSMSSFFADGEEKKNSTPVAEMLIPQMILSKEIAPIREERIALVREIINPSPVAVEETILFQKPVVESVNLVREPLIEESILPPGFAQPVFVSQYEPAAIIERQQLKAPVVVEEVYTPPAYIPAMPEPVVNQEEPYYNNMAVETRKNAKSPIYE